ncbi:lytic transglycosylase domain-containing protein [Lipingzhangella sp. LS1_29]|uniref:Lytic transglycosylase domain-containing protein n=1 Tax=Lipingzhangella rawalii TaxID=2055835 RepID=A0ABU2H9Y7_9ACTN|nr:lytic transglycosylase domain-containing protein [Lipingzhangella rawalii]MDS1272140.1 lytic transglycosylase domain-containing protein [Lipingzhangella rawalii]
MLLNRISLRSAAAVGSATMVVGATFAVSAFADSGQPEQTSAQAAPEVTEESSPFFGEGQDLSEEELEALQEQSSEVTAGSAASAAGTVEEDEEEEEEEEEQEEEPEATGGSVPSGSPREIAQAMLGDYGWGQDQWSCLDNLWEKESNWDHTAENPSSGAYGIPQSLPGDKMASAGADWRTNPATQIEWGLGYIDEQYGSPCGAWGHSQQHNWY